MAGSVDSCPVSSALVARAWRLFRPRCAMFRIHTLLPQLPPKDMDRMSDGRGALQCRFLEHAPSSLFILFRPESVQSQERLRFFDPVHQIHLDDRTRAKILGEGSRSSSTLADNQGRVPWLPVRGASALGLVGLPLKCAHVERRAAGSRHVSQINEAPPPCPRVQQQQQRQQRRHQHRCRFAAPYALILWSVAQLALGSLRERPRARPSPGQRRQACSWAWKGHRKLQGASAQAAIGSVLSIARAPPYSA